MAIRSPLNVIRKMLNGSFSKQEIISFLEELSVTNPDWFFKNGAVKASEDLCKATHYDAVYKMHTLGTPVDVQSLRGDFGKILLYLPQDNPLPGLCTSPLYFKGLSSQERKPYHLPYGEYVENLVHVEELGTLVNFFYDTARATLDAQTCHELWRSKAFFFLDFEKMSQEARLSLLESFFANKNREQSNNFGYTDMFSNAMEKLLVGFEREKRQEWLSSFLHNIKDVEQIHADSLDYFFKSSARIVFDALVEHQYHPAWVKETYESAVGKPFFSWYFKYKNFAKQRGLPSEMVSLFLSPDALLPSNDVLSSDLLRKALEKAMVDFIEQKKTKGGDTVFLVQAIKVLVEDTQKLVHYLHRSPDLNEEQKQHWLQHLSVIDIASLDEKVTATTFKISEEDWRFLLEIEARWNKIVFSHRIKALDSPRLKTTVSCPNRF